MKQESLLVKFIALWQVLHLSGGPVVSFLYQKWKEKGLNWFNAGDGSHQLVFSLPPSFLTSIPPCKTGPLKLAH